MWQGFKRGIIFNSLALSLTVALSPLSYALEPINSTQDGQIIKGGNYYNTADSKTMFVNTASGDLWLQAGAMVRGLEVNGSGNLTNNGGSIHLSAPGHVVRVDGTIDVGGVVNGQGAFLGNGGKVTVDATYLYQNGNIFAQGANGGHVQFNVNSVSIGPQTRIDATGRQTGLGGTIGINATGVVDIKLPAELITSGVAGVDSNVIEVTGGLVNNSGFVRADGIAFINSRDVELATGGTIRLVSQGNINLNPVGNAINQSNVFTPAEKETNFNTIHSLAVDLDGSIRNQAVIEAEGGVLNRVPGQIQGDGGNGGSITLTASKNIINSFDIFAIGGAGDSAGNGGQITLSGNQLSQNTGRVFVTGGDSLSTNGLGGAGGNITLKNCNITGAGSLNAYGGSGQFGGDGGSIDISHVSTNGQILAHGGNSFPSMQTPGGIAGNGGIITVTDTVNGGTISARGGEAFDPSPGGGGGLITLTNVTNTGSITVNGGDGKAAGTSTAGSPGGNGGRLNGDNVINSGTMTANGGSSNIRGGDGGTMFFSKLENDFNGIVSANGGNGVADPDHQTIGGNGGILKGKQVFGFGLFQAQGGTGDTNGQDGHVVLF